MDVWYIYAPFLGSSGSAWEIFKYLGNRVTTPLSPKGPVEALNQQIRSPAGERPQAGRDYICSGTSAFIRKSWRRRTMERLLTIIHFSYDDIVLSKFRRWDPFWLLRWDVTVLSNPCGLIWWACLLYLIKTMARAWITWPAKVICNRWQWCVLYNTLWAFAMNNSMCYLTLA